MICATLVGGGIFMAGDAFASCGGPHMTVCAPAPPDEPVCPAGQCEDDGGYDHGGGDGGEGGNEETPPVPPAQCLTMMAEGLPPDCSRELAYSSENPIAGFAPPGMGDIVFPGSDYWIAQTAESLAAGLNGCYSDISYTPESCEWEYYSGWQGMQVIVNQQSEAARDAYSAMMFSMTWAINNASQARWAAQWFGDSVEYSVGSIGLNLNLITNVLLLDYMNQALIASRKTKLCQLWMAVWDGNNCSSY